MDSTNHRSKKLGVEEIPDSSKKAKFLSTTCKCFPGGSAGKESSCNVGDLGSIPGLEKSPGEGNSYPLQYSGLENSMDCIVHASQRVRHD